MIKSAHAIDVVAGVADGRRHHAIGIVFCADRVGAGRGQAARRDEEARAGRETAIDRVPEAGVVGSEAFGAQVAICGVSREQRKAHVVDGSDGALYDAFVPHLVGLMRERYKHAKKAWVYASTKPDMATLRRKSMSPCFISAAMVSRWMTYAQWHRWRG